MSISLVGVGLPTGMAGWKLLQNKTPADFKAFSKDPILQRDVGYLREKLPSKLSSKELLADRRLQEMVLKAYGLDAQVGMNALMGKVLDSDVTDTGSVAYRMTDSRYRQIASDFNYGGLAVPEVPAVPSTARVMVEGLRAGAGFATFSGSFGGIAVKDLPLRDVQSYSQLAERLQAAFRAADGGNGDIRVVAAGPELVFTDAKARAQTPALGFVPASGSRAAATVIESTRGTPGSAAQGGPNVAKPDFIEQIVQRYTQARFEESLGDTSGTLRKAIYAKRSLPQITSWYSIIADRNLAEVVQSTLGLPDSFGRLDVDRQKQILESRMPLSDFKDPAKLSRLLDRYVAQTSVAEARALSSSSGVVSLVQPVSWGQDSVSGASGAAIFSILSGR
ncbi:DUF1217 domain-containing protein [Roseomonas sp. M0104]|uniref:DUF1217 domain-containing protein n=1 Tax=Teichococcus coralli TaxID=2545983 RepID=A0A845BD95_9PROT|nr:DUF1217 domain-containing protein [Pseudoroseomonas coralli]MXP65563.1 DUF1217 domain-containing protein [Pseudoroseomonas coralli]